MSNTYSYQEAYEASLEYFNGDELAARVWVNKYALKDSKGNIYEKTPTDMHRRLAKEIARIENKYPNPLSESTLFDLFDHFKYIVPQGGPMTGIGNPYQIQSLSNCLLVGLEGEPDSYGGIMKIDEEQIQIMKRRGGVGHDLSHLRPANASVSNAALTSSGVVSFMERYSNSTREVGQGGRRGALMLSLSINHPDAEAFIDAKMTEGKITGANVSVKIDDAFMDAVSKDEVYVQKFPIYSDNPSVKKEIKARDLWKKIVHNAWKSAEPGVLFWDTVIRESVADCYADLGFKTVSTNPCVTGDTTLLTRKGYVHISDLVGKEIEIWNGYEWSTVTPFKTSDNAKVYLVKFSDGYELKCTEYHKFVLKGGVRKELKDVVVGDKIENYFIPANYCDLNENRKFKIEDITIESIDEYGSEPTYCVNEPKNHTALFNMVMTGNCGEVPLCPYDSCRLLALNLFSYVRNPFCEDAYFDKNMFADHAWMALRIMDDIIDLELEKIDQIITKVENDPESDEVKATELNLWKKIRKKCEMGRRTGIGITAEGDMLAALGLRYGTEEASEFSENVHKVLAGSVYYSSVYLARERGAFPIYDSEREKNNPFIGRLREEYPQMYDDMLKYGRRNIACLTIAPTGTVSLMTQTTSGIEPVFMPVYKRRRKVNHNDQDSHVDFIDSTGDAFEEYLVIHPKFKMWMDMNGHSLDKGCSQEEIDNLVSKSPYYQATSRDIDWLQKVRMQGRIQKWVDHSISVTINLPEDVDEELVDKLYFEAWKCGCKGCTVYRDGSRSGVLVSVSDKKDVVGNNKKRPKVLKADVVRFKHNSQNWIAFVGLLNERPYEIFTGLIDDEEGILLPKSVKTGEIEKYKDSKGYKHYRFTYKNKAGMVVAIENLETKFSSEFWNYAKLISATLRYEMPIHKAVGLIQSLDWNNESINNWSNGVVRALKRYIKDGTKAKGKVCPNCGQETLVFQEGCLICTNCGNSRCG